MAKEKRKLETIAWWDKQANIMREVQACPSCGGPMLDDSRISGMCCQDCRREIYYMVKKNE